MNGPPETRGMEEACSWNASCLKAMVRMRSLQPAWETWQHTVEGSGEWRKRDRQISSESLVFFCQIK